MDKKKKELEEKNKNMPTGTQALDEDELEAVAGGATVVEWQAKMICEGMGSKAFRTVYFCESGGSNDDIEKHKQSCDQVAKKYLR